MLLIPTKMSELIPFYDNMVIIHELEDKMMRYLLFSP